MEKPKLLDFKIGNQIRIMMKIEGPKLLINLVCVCVVRCAMNTLSNIYFLTYFLLVKIHIDFTK